MMTPLNQESDTCVASTWMEEKSGSTSDIVRWTMSYSLLVKLKEGWLVSLKTSERDTRAYEWVLK